MSAGVRSHMVDCRICGQRYRQTNLMKRWAHPETLHIWSTRYHRIPPPSSGYDYVDTHVIAHWKRGERALAPAPTAGHEEDGR